MSKIEVDAITQQSGTTLTVGGGACKTATVDATTVSLGRSGGTVSLAAGATQSGFGRTGTVDWQTGSIKTSTFTAANGEGYFANTSGGAFTMNLPAGTAGNIVSVVDYTNTFQTNALTIAPNGSQKIGGIEAGISLSTEGQSVTFVYVDDTEGWKNVQDSTSNVTGNPFLVATGGTETTSGNFKIHTFTGPGTFTVSRISQTAAENTVGYMVVGGGGGGGGGNGSGGGGAGGFREGRNVPIDNFTASPIVANAPTNAVTVTAQAYPITVGGGGPAPSSGSNSIFSTITSAGGGSATANGGSGGGASYNQVPAGSGNTPPVSPSQGNGGGGTVGDNTTSPGTGAGGGGGATAVGTTAPNNTNGGPGGAGATTSITGSPVTYSGGGGGGVWGPAPSNNGRGTGGSGGGGQGGGPTGSPTQTGGNGTANTGGGAGGGGGTYAVTAHAGGTGGSGIVVIRYKFQ